MQTKTQSNNNAQHIENIEDFVNHFKKFYEKFKNVIREGREFWTLNLFEVLTEINS